LAQCHYTVPEWGIICGMVLWWAGTCTFKPGLIKSGPVTIHVHVHVDLTTICCMVLWWAGTFKPVLIESELVTADLTTIVVHTCCIPYL